MLPLTNWRETSLWAFLYFSETSLSHLPNKAANYPPTSIKPETTCPTFQFETKSNLSLAHLLSKFVLQGCKLSAGTFQFPLHIVGLDLGQFRAQFPESRRLQWWKLYYLNKDFRLKFNWFNRIASVDVGRRKAGVSGRVHGLNHYLER